MKIDNAMKGDMTFKQRKKKIPLIKKNNLLTYKIFVQIICP